MQHRLVFAALTAAVSLLGGASPALAGGDTGTDDGRFTCRASAIRVTSPVLNSEPIVANRAQDPCRDEFAQLANVTLGTPFRADLVNARTDVEQDRATASSSVLTSTIRVGDSFITAGVLESQAQVVCDPKSGQPAFSGSSRIVSLVINGRPIVITGRPNQTINASPLVVVVINEQIQTSDQLTVRALAVRSPLLGTSVIVAESIVDVHDNPCAPAPPPPPPPKTQCSDGVDNDFDKRTDFGDDPECTSPEDDDESK